MITSNRLPLLKRSKLRSVINFDNRNKRYGSLLIMNTTDIKNLKQKLGILNIDYNGIMTMCYTKRREEIKIRNKTIRQNVFNERPAHYNAINAELPMLTGINEGKLNLGYNLFFDLVRAKCEAIIDLYKLEEDDIENIYIKLPDSLNDLNTLSSIISDLDPSFHSG